MVNVFAEYKPLNPILYGSIPKPISSRHRILGEIIRKAPEQDIARLKNPISGTTQAKIKENNYFVAEFMFEVLGEVLSL